MRSKEELKNWQMDRNADLEVVSMRITGDLSKKRYLTKAVEIQAVKYWGEDDPFHFDEDPDWLFDAVETDLIVQRDGNLFIRLTDISPMQVKIFPGQYLVKNTENHFSIYSPQSFNEKYLTIGGNTNE
ncbi:MAG: hypothetical protein RR643_04890 [Anaerorhabdus sp.]|uniref:hypothetical protein n=1 Tax=Anaerorhabdus sp. TaxID=1872524 RepID=UPI002FC8B3DA